jgi:guanylate kinase
MTVEPPSQTYEGKNSVLSEWEEPPLIMVISAPSGTGKSTICRRVIELSKSSTLFDRELEFSVSTTTRDPRRSEVDGTDYNFVDENRFKDLKNNEEFLESAMVHGEYYGTSKSSVESAVESGKDVLLEIDVQGGQQVKERCNNAVLVFIAPPSLPELERRLKNRGTETEEEIEQRLERARAELDSIDLYDYVVINDEIDDAVNKIISIRTAEKCRLDRQFDDTLFGSVSNDE